jgi:hypothetical protein
MPAISCAWATPADPARMQPGHCQPGHARCSRLPAPAPGPSMCCSAASSGHSRTCAVLRSAAPRSHSCPAAARRARAHVQPQHDAPGAHAEARHLHLATALRDDQLTVRPQPPFHSAHVVPYAAPRAPRRYGRAAWPRPCRSCCCSQREHERHTEYADDDGCRPVHLRLTCVHIPCPCDTIVRAFARRCDLWRPPLARRLARSAACSPSGGPPAPTRMSPPPWSAPTSSSSIVSTCPNGADRRRGQQSCG